MTDVEAPRKEYIPERSDVATRRDRGEVDRILVRANILKAYLG